MSLLNQKPRKRINGAKKAIPIGDLPKISVIMPSYLGFYEGCSTNREAKLLRAIDTFYKQDYPRQKCNLIIVADGCQQTVDMFQQFYKQVSNIECLLIVKQKLFSGYVRQYGINWAKKHHKAEIICYLDNDDYIAPDHLKNIANAFKKGDYDWIFFNDALYLDPKSNKFGIRDTSIAFGSIGTSNIAHKSNIGSWKDCDGWGHDYKFITQLQELSEKCSKFGFYSYIVCHLKGLIDN